MASVYRLVALGEERPGLFHLRFDGPAVRVFWALIISGVISMVIWLIALAIALAAGGLGFGDYFRDMGEFFMTAINAALTGSEDMLAMQAVNITSTMKALGRATLIAMDRTVSNAVSHRFRSDK